VDNTGYTRGGKMKKYYLSVLKKIIESVGNRLFAAKDRGYYYMAKGAYVSYLEGKPYSMKHLMKILKWTLKAGYLSLKEWETCLRIYKNFQKIERKKDVKSTVLNRIPGKIVPWQEWPTQEN
jgi:hypothetical protein